MGNGQPPSFCPDCGAELSNENYCPECGNRLIEKTSEERSETRKISDDYTTILIAILSPLLFAVSFPLEVVYEPSALGNPSEVVNGSDFWYMIFVFIPGILTVIFTRKIGKLHGAVILGIFMGSFFAITPVASVWLTGLETDTEFGIGYYLWWLASGFVIIAMLYEAKYAFDGYETL